MWERGKPVLLTGQERELICETVTAWLEALPSVKDATIEDRTLTTPEQLLDLTTFYHEQEHGLKRILAKLKRDTNEKKRPHE